VLLTSSCTDALEMSALLLNIEQGDEVIMPSYTFVSTANAFILRGATIKFVDSRPDHPGMDESLIEELITKKTKVIVPVHYAGVACDMGKIMDIAKQNDLIVVEDAAQAIDSYYKGHALGGIGDLAAFSFHETKNIIAGEGGMLSVNNQEYQHRSEIIWEKGTNRSAFWRGEVDKYGWVDIGSSFLPSELTAAFLFAQLEHLEEIQKRRKAIWQRYSDNLECLRDKIQLPFIPEYATNNAHMFYLVCDSNYQRNTLIKRLNELGINAVFHYQSLHASTFFKDKHDGRNLKYSDRYSDCLMRLPLHLNLSVNDIDFIIETLVQEVGSYNAKNKA
jgi:dTDP-4-amino-4,6-dideoxygalactose transaminase